MNKIFQILILMLFPFGAVAIDFNDVSVPYYAKVEVSDGVTPRVFDMYYDGFSKTLLVGPPPRGAQGNMRMYGDIKTSEFFFWVEEDPEKKMFTMNQLDFSKSLGVDVNKVVKDGVLVGKKKFLGEECEHWRLELTLDEYGKK